MLKIENIKIKIRKDFIEYYENLGYTVIENMAIISTNHLNNGSSVYVTVVCDCCGEEKQIRYKEYYQIIKRSDDNKYYCKKCKYSRIKNTNNKKYGVDNVMQIKDVSIKMMNTQKQLYGKLKINDIEYINNKIIEKYGDLETYYKKITDKRIENCLNKYGVDNVMKNKNIKEKQQQTCLDKYGDINPMFIPEFIEKSRVNQLKTKKERGLIIPENKLSDFQLYKKIIRRLVYKYKKKLYENWDGYDYYDGEYIKNNLSLNHTNVDYPSIDHKTSVYFGFTNNIDPNYIGNINNLCITKRRLNSSKCKKSEFDFKK